MKKIRGELSQSETILDNGATYFNFFYGRERKKMPSKDITVLSIAILLGMSVLCFLAITIFQGVTKTTDRDLINQDVDKIVMTGDFSETVVIDFIKKDRERYPLSFILSDENWWKEVVYSTIIPESFNKWSDKLNDEKKWAGNDNVKFIIYNRDIALFQNNYSAYLNHIKEYTKNSNKVYGVYFK